MKEYTKGQMDLAFSLGLLVASAFWGMAAWRIDAKWRQSAVKNNCAYYDPTTADFVWRNTITPQGVKDAKD